jgi:hypothetical protein
MRKDPGCLEDVLGLTGMAITEAQYQALSHQTVKRAWAIFEAQKRDAQNGGYHNPGVYYVDERLVTAITDETSTCFITCFHEHFDRPHGEVPRPGTTVGQRKLLYKRRLDVAEDCKIFINVTRKTGV